MRRLLLFSTLLTCGQLSAQGFYSDHAIVSIAPGTILSIPDSIVNTGTLINNGSMIIAGAWINSGTYDAGSGQVTFNSDVTQVINHNAQSMENLVIDGGGHKEFLADIIVESSLSLQKGILVSKNGARIIVEQAATIDGGSDESHVDGPVERKGIGNWLFPVGNGVSYLPVVITSSSEATAFGIVTPHEITNEILATDAGLDKISTKRYWELASGGNALNAAVITLPIVDEDGIDGDNVTVAGSNTLTGPYNDLRAGAFSGVTITSKDAPVFKYYAIASVQLDHSIEVFNAISPNNDGKNDLMFIKNIEFYSNNKVLIHNRWGDRVFEASAYDNDQVAFRGISSNGSKLPAGTYFYSIDLGNGSEKTTGYLVIK
jgi:gliding motility-associated-like protein